MAGTGKGKGERGGVALSDQTEKHRSALFCDQCQKVENQSASRSDNDLQTDFLIRSTVKMFS